MLSKVKTALQYPQLLLPLSINQFFKHFSQAILWQFGQILGFSIFIRQIQQITESFISFIISLSLISESLFIESSLSIILFGIFSFLSLSLMSLFLFLTYTIFLFPFFILMLPFSIFFLFMLLFFVYLIILFLSLKFSVFASGKSFIFSF